MPENRDLGTDKRSKNSVGYPFWCAPLKVPRLHFLRMTPLSFDSLDARPSWVRTFFNTTRGHVM